MTEKLELIEYVDSIWDNRLDGSNAIDARR